MILRRAFAAACVVAALAIDALLAFGVANRALDHAIKQLSGAIASLRTGDVRQAVDLLELVSASAGQAATTARHPAAWLADPLPWSGDDIDAVAALAISLRHAARAGLLVSDGAAADLVVHELGRARAALPQPTGSGPVPAAARASARLPALLDDIEALARS